MSRLGKKTIEIPAGVTVTVADAVVTVAGPKGTLTQEIFDGYTVSQEENRLTVTPESEGKEYFAKWGLLAVLISNMVQGVSKGFQKALIADGVGYKVAVQSGIVRISAGFSHPFMYKAPEGVEITVEGANKIVVSGYDKQKVGQVAAEIRGIRPPEPYKGKGIRYDGEVIVRKAGKAGSK